MYLQGSKGANEPVRVLQFSDTHFFAKEDGRLLGVNTAKTFAAVLEQAIRENGSPDLCLLTGDISQDETTESYERIADAIAPLGAPVYFIPGNHDDRRKMSDVFSKRSDTFCSERGARLGKWRFALLNSKIEAEVGGRLSGEDLDWLDKFLGEDQDAFALVCLHHHPVPMGSEWLDEIGLANGDEFFAVLNKYPSVRAVVWGHVHQQFDGMRGGVRLFAAPSTCVQFKPASPVFACDQQKPGYRYFELMPNGEIRSEVRRAAAAELTLDLSSKGY